MSAKRQRPPTDELLTDIYESNDPRVKQPIDTDGGNTHLDPPRPPPIPPPRIPKTAPQPTPIRVISLKTPPEIEAEQKATLPVREHKVAIRALSDVRRRQDTPPSGFGHLAPPRDPREVRARRVRDHVIWGSVVVIVASAVMLGVWFLARS